MTLADQLLTRPGRVASAWTTVGPRPPLPDRWDEQEWWVRTLKREGFTSYFKPAGRPTVSFVLYRGASMDRAAGISWTLSESVANMYARCKRGPSGMLGAYLDPPPGEVWVATVDPSAMLAILPTQSGTTNRFDEIEVLCDPAGLGSIGLALHPWGVPWMS